VRQSDYSHAKFVKDAQQIHVRAERFDPFQREHERDPSCFSCLDDFPIASANTNSTALLRLGVDSRDLTERYAQSHVRQVAILDINCRRYDPNVAGFEFGQELRREHIPAITLFE
jgi:hypothetical protein